MEFYPDPAEILSKYSISNLLNPKPSALSPYTLYGKPSASKQTAAHATAQKNLAAHPILNLQVSAQKPPLPSGHKGHQGQASSQTAAHKQPHARNQSDDIEQGAEGSSSAWAVPSAAGRRRRMRRRIASDSQVQEDGQMGRPVLGMRSESAANPKAQMRAWPDFRNVEVDHLISPKDPSHDSARRPSSSLLRRVLSDVEVQQQSGRSERSGGSGEKVEGMQVLHPSDALAAGLTARQRPKTSSAYAPKTSLRKPPAPETEKVASEKLKRPQTATQTPNYVEPIKRAYSFGKRPSSVNSKLERSKSEIAKANAAVNHVDPSKLSGDGKCDFIRKKLAEASGKSSILDPLLFYDMGQELGKGAFGAVKLATHVISGEKVAIKIYDKYKVHALHKNQGHKVDDDIVLHEVRILERLHHPNIISLIQTISTSKKVHMVLDYASAGDLADYVKFKKILSEDEARGLYKQILSGVSHIHQKKIVHRDLKMENVMLWEDKTIKIIDFGMGEFIDSGRKLKLQCGTPAYAAPEIWADKSYSGAQVDVWSLGVMLFAMVCGKMPFHHPNAQKMCELISAAKYTFGGTASELSAGCKGMISQILVPNPQKRPSVKTLEKHAWIGSTSGPSLNNSFDDLLDAEVDSEAAAEMEKYGFDLSILSEEVRSSSRTIAAACHTLVKRRNRRSKP